MRFGTRTENKRKWTPQGHRPLAPMKIGYEFSYLYLAIKPYTGEIFAMIMPYMTTECFELFIKEFNQCLNRTTMLIADKASTHQSKVTKDTLVVLQHLPTACPELNPVERFFKEMRKELANKIFDSIEDAEKQVVDALMKLSTDTQKVIKLTMFPYIKHAVCF
jgi:transposase